MPWHERCPEEMTTCRGIYETDRPQALIRRLDPERVGESLGIRPWMVNATKVLV
jgi:hypothetical protein